MARPDLNATRDRAQPAAPDPSSEPSSRELRIPRGQHPSIVSPCARRLPVLDAKPTRADAPRIDVDDVQGIVLRGYVKLPECRYLLLSIEDGSRARDWLAALLPSVSPGQPAASEVALHVAFTSAGLEALGLDESALAGFSREFSEGMVGDHRSRFLGDQGESDPTHWQWGGPNNPTFHVLLILLADTPARLQALVSEMRDLREKHGGLSERHELAAATLSDSEPFGFRDGISQPAIEGYHPAPSSLHLLKAGEFLLGYPNEYGQYTDRPLLPGARDPKGRLGLDRGGSPRHDLGLNGTYLVFRQLRQDVAGFRATLDALTRRSDGTVDLAARERLAAKMVGRWKSGASLVLSPDADDPRNALANEFRYHREDPDGLRCPIGSHVRRANPRDALDPKPGSEDSLNVNRHHRLIRRGRSYGPPSDGRNDGVERGIFFIALNANISRQFEFVQHSWLLDPRFNGRYGEADPIAGCMAQNQFSIPGPSGPLRCLDLPRFVDVVGGAYFFLPSLSALRFLSELQS